MVRIKFLKSVILFFSLNFLANFSFSQIQNINISGGNTFDGEPFLAVNPTNPQNMVIAWMGITITGGVRVSIKTKATFDGGTTWGSYHVQPHVAALFHSADVSMSFRNDGALYLSYIDHRENPDSGVIYLSESVDGGVNWTFRSEIWNLSEDTVKMPIDRPWLSCDNSSTSNNGMLYITTKPAPWVPAPNRPYLKSSADSGITWSNYRFVDTTSYLVGNLIQAPMGAIATSADGALCIAYPSYVVTQSPFPKIYFAKSYNRSASFQYTELVNNPVFPGDTNLKSGYCLAANSADSAKLAFAYVGGQLGDADIFVCTTEDGGITWSTPVRVNDDAVANGKLQDLVWASYNSSGGLAVTWRDRRNGSGTGFYQPCEIYCSISNDNGAHFRPNFSLSTMEAPFDSVLALDGNDFMSCSYIGDSICAAWGDVRSGKLNIYFSKTSDSTGISTGLTLINSEELPCLKVFPDPASTHVNILLPFMYSGAMLEVYDESGKKVFQKNDPKDHESIDCSRFADGTYFVVLKSGGFSDRQKLIIAR